MTGVREAGSTPEMPMRKARTELVAPRPAAMIESLRDIGYAFPAAIADIVDNSITAGASEIEILDNSDSERPAVAVLDDGCGMSEDELREAMRPGTTNPRDGRAARDLGRFGLGLKTASFSQCRRLTVVTRKGHEASARRWDLDTVAAEDEWLLETPDDIREVPFIDRLGEQGTLVIWENLDRVTGRGDPGGRRLTEQLADAASHLELVFHRFLAGSLGGRRSVRIRLNARPLEPFDPFHSRHPATHFDPEETLRLAGDRIRIQTVTLPHHQKVSANDWKRYGGQGGYLKNQGFYVYREGRLIIHGTWFRLAPQAELTKLSRVRVDIPNSLDEHWKIDIKKGSAQLPPSVRERLKGLAERLGAGSRRAYAKRGTKLTEEREFPVWRRSQTKNRISYTIDEAHPALRAFASQLEPSVREGLRSLVDLIAESLPLDSLQVDLAGAPERMATPRQTDNSWRRSFRLACEGLRQRGYTVERLRLIAPHLLSGDEPADRAEIVEAVLNEFHAEQEEGEAS